MNFRCVYVRPKKIFFFYVYNAIKEMELEWVHTLVVYASVALKESARIDILGSPEGDAEPPFAIQSTRLCMCIYNAYTTLYFQVKTSTNELNLLLNKRRPCIHVYPSII